MKQNADEHGGLLCPSPPLHSPHHMNPRTPSQQYHKDVSFDVPSDAVFGVASDAKLFFENYGCGCVWAVPEEWETEFYPAICKSEAPRLRLI